MAKISRRRLARYLAGEFAAGQVRPELLKQTAAYLVLNKQVKQIDLLVRDIAEILELEHGKVLAEVTSASNLSDELVSYIHSILKAGSGSEFQIDNTVDPGLIGGVIVKTPSRELDTSIRSKLKLLRSA